MSWQCRSPGESPRNRLVGCLHTALKNVLQYLQGALQYTACLYCNARPVCLWTLKNQTDCNPPPICAACNTPPTCIRIAPPIYIAALLDKNSEKLKGSLLKGSFDKRVHIDLPDPLPVPTPHTPPSSLFPHFSAGKPPPPPPPTRTRTRSQPLPHQGPQWEPAPLCENYPDINYLFVFCPKF